MSLWQTRTLGESRANSPQTRIRSKSLIFQSPFFLCFRHLSRFAGTTIDDAAGWTWEYTNQNTPGIAVAAASNAPDLWIAETGWPTGANETAYETYEGAVAGTQQLQTFLDTFVCQANTNITTDATAGATGAGSYNKYAFFEAIDEPWKKMYGGVEPFWGLFDSNKQLKNVTIPDCAAP